jgi:hypothetical protein
MERNCLFRGIIDEVVAIKRRQKLIASSDIEDQPLGIDWYNVLITVESHLRGLPLFIAEDGVVRDTSATHGSYRSSPITERAIQEIIEVITAARPARIDVYLDEPIAFSGLMAEIVRERLGRLPHPFAVALAHSADYPLKTYEGIVASSDSVILDSASRIIDLARLVLRRGFDFTPPPVLDLFPSAPEGAPQ